MRSFTNTRVKGKDQETDYQLDRRVAAAAAAEQERYAHLFFMRKHENVQIFW